MTGPQDIGLAIMTVDRSPQYVHSTLASLLLSDSAARELGGLHLVVGQHETDYLDCYSHHENIHVHPMSEEEATGGSGWVIHQRACLNYYRCLTIPGPSYRGLCICEDDVVFCQGFVRKLLDIINDLDRAGKEKFVVSAYLPGELMLSSRSRQSAYGLYPPRMFFGTQCMYYPRSVVPEVATAVRDNGVICYRGPYDILVREYAISTDCLYGPTRSLVQHVGKSSTGLGSFHVSGTFASREQRYCAPVRII